jgi:hypothetical protein
MGRVVTFLVLTVVILSVRPLSPRERADEELPITIQIHDYWHVPTESLSRASAVVTNTYEKIGVRTEWLDVVRQGDKPRASKHRRETSRIPNAQLTIIILTKEMAARGQIADGALGMAAVADEGMGRIAYAIYDRVRDTAVRAGLGEADLLGFVMAHEIGHLLLPRGSHVESGLMRGSWTIRNLRRTDVANLEFSPLQASAIRATIENNSPVVRTRGSRALAKHEFKATR